MPGVYFQNELYIRLSNGKWSVATHLNGSWRASASGGIPLKLENAKDKGNKGKGKSFGKKRKKRKKK